jgi:tetratricopeptide (TPR) repeat protein
MATDDEVRKLAAKGWSDEIDALFENGLPDSQMKILEEAGLFDDDDVADDLPPPIDDDADLAIQDLLEQAENFFADSNFDDAIKAFNTALKLLPEPHFEYDYATRAYAGIGDAHFSKQDYQNCLTALETAKKCDGGLGNPFVHLRLGQAYLRLGNEDNAADNLMRAYMAGGGEVFEEEDPEFLTFLRTKAMIE